MCEKSNVKSKRCHSCSKKKSLLTACKYCKHSFCFSCLQQEVHECENLEEMKMEKHKLLKNRLESERCIKRKLECL